MRHSWVGAVLSASLLAGCGSGRTAHTRPALGDAGPALGDARIATGAAGAVGECAGPAQLDAGIPAFQVTGCRHAVDAGVELAVFSWQNRTGEVQTARYGSLNQVSPGAAAQGQSESFPIGASGTFVVAMAGAPVTWAILDHSVSVSSDSADCAAACSRFELAGPDSYEVDTCTTACGDGTCDRGESCQSCAADCDCTALEPTVDCVSLLASGKRHVSFGVRNGALLGAGILVGPQNHLAPGQDAQGQPVFFPPGEQHGVFDVTYSGTELTWALGSASVTATDSAPACPQTCGDCGAGAVCVGGSCQHSCGDGQCNGTEDCNNCAADCGCGSLLCYHGGCASLARCGEDAECGTLDSFGTHLDCGACPSGLACVRHLCTPVCADGGGAP